MARGCSLFEEAPLHFWATRTWIVHKSLQQPFKMQTSATMSSMMRKKEAGITGLFFQEDRYVELNSATHRTCVINDRHAWNRNLTSISSCWWSFSSTMSYLLSLPQSVAFLACPSMTAFVGHGSPQYSCLSRIPLDKEPGSLQFIGLQS